MKRAVLWTDLRYCYSGTFICCMNAFNGACSPMSQVTRILLIVVRCLMPVTTCLTVLMAQHSDDL